MLIITKELIELRQILRLQRLAKSLHTDGLTDQQRLEQTQRRVEVILRELWGLPQEKQHAIRAALCQLGLLPERRCGQERRGGTILPPGDGERRRAAERRLERDLSRWLGETEK